jgi:hypothetical protein
MTDQSWERNPGADIGDDGDVEPDELLEGGGDAGEGDIGEGDSGEEE